jgi:hypothetical protein
MRLHSEPSMSSGVRSVLAIASSSMIGTQGETNCGEIGHLRQVCPKPPKERFGWKMTVWR